MMAKGQVVQQLTVLLPSGYTGRAYRPDFSESVEVPVPWCEVCFFGDCLSALSKISVAHYCNSVQHSVVH